MGTVGSFFACHQTRKGPADSEKESTEPNQKRNPETPAGEEAKPADNDLTKRSPNDETDDDKPQNLEVPDELRGSSLHMDSKWFESLEDVLPEEINKLFVCVAIPQETQDIIYERLEPFITKHNLRDDENIVWQKGIMLHMTLLYIGNANKYQIINDLGGADGLETEVFRNGLKSFSHRKTAKLRVMSNMPNESLTALAQEVMNYLPDYNGDITRFKGHISLCVFTKKCERAEEIVDLFMKECGEISLEDISWEVNEVSLFSSDTRPYKCVHTIPLREPPPPRNDTPSGGKIKLGALSSIGSSISEKFRSMSNLFTGDSNDLEKKNESPSVTSTEALKGTKKKKEKEPELPLPEITDSPADNATSPENPGEIKDGPSLNISKVRSNADLKDDIDLEEIRDEVDDKQEKPNLTLAE